MQGLLEFPDTLLWSTTCEVGKGNFSPFVNPLEAKGIMVSCYNPLRKNIITCQDQYKEEFLDEIDGLDLNLKLSTEIIGIPSYVPVLDVRSAKTGNIPANCPIVAVTLWDIMKRSISLKAGRYHEMDNISFRTDLLSKKNFKSRKVILLLTGSDTLIEWIWYNREECRLFETIKDMGIWAVGGFNFSLIDGECPFSHALNLKRSLFSAMLVERAGLLAIPHAYSLNNNQTSRWINWFKANPRVKLFTINCQLQKSECDINQVVTAVKDILGSIPHLNVLLQGFHLNKIDRFGHFLSRVHFADKIAAKYAQSHRKIFFDVKKHRLDDEHAGKLNLAELLESNISIRNSFVEEIRNENLKRVGLRA